MIEEIFLSNYFNGERVIIDSVRLVSEGSSLYINDENIFSIEGFPNYKQPVEISVNRVKLADNKLVVSLDPVSKVLGGNLFNRKNLEFFYLLDSTQDQWLTECFLNYLEFSLNNKNKINHKLFITDRTKVTISHK